MISVILVGAGSGRRLGSDLPKAFLEIGGKELFCYSLETFHPIADELVLVLPAEYVDSRIVSVSRVFPGTIVTPGGKERQQSVYNGLSRLKARTGIVLVHDSARPFCSQSLIDRVIQGARRYGACVPVISNPDTLKQVHNQKIIKTLDRECVSRVQTPQAFQFGIIWDSFEKAIAEGFVGSDDSSLVERRGISVHAVMGETLNFKVTQPEDVDYAEFLLGRTGGKF